jgi:hypothetical protein
MAARQSARDGRWTKKYPFVYRELKEVAAAGQFDTDQAKTDTPTLTFATYRNPDTLKSGMINRIHYRLNFANAVTYQLRLWAAAIAADYESNLNMLYEGAAAQADDTDYDITELDIPFILAAEGLMYYSIDWTAACGNIQGFIEVSGETYE